MRKALFPLFVALTMVACQNNAPKEDTTEPAAEENTVAEQAAPSNAFFGAEITEDGAIEAMSIAEQLGEMDSMEVKVVGTVNKVCQVKGCWMMMDAGGDDEMRVTFKDYGFFVPKDIDGKSAVIEGKVFMETTSVEDLRHYAEDEGLSEEEIMAITEPETSLTFVADGVIVKDYEVTASVEETSEESHEHGDDHEGHDH